MEDSVTQKVISAVASVKHIPEEKITLDSSLADLGLDSLDTITMLFELEEKFHVAIPDEHARSIRTVREMVEGIRRLLAGGTLGAASPAD